jgi:hypothetical protein
MTTIQELGTGAAFSSARDQAADNRRPHRETRWPLRERSAQVSSAPSGPMGANTSTSPGCHSSLRRGGDRSDDTPRRVRSNLRV